MNNGNNKNDYPMGFFTQAVYKTLFNPGRLSKKQIDSRDRFEDIGSTDLMNSKRMSKILLEKFWGIKTKDDKDLNGVTTVGVRDFQLDYARELAKKDDSLNEYITKSGKTINASKVIKGETYKLDDKYSIIATQCPTPKMMDCFMDLISTSKITTVVCLSIQPKKMFHYWDRKKCEEKGLRTLMEGGRGTAWTQIPGSSFVYRFNTQKGGSCRDFSIMELIIGELDDETQNVTVKKDNVGFILYRTWPDHSLPLNLDVFESLMQQPALLQQRKLLVHCAGGAGRTGVFCACFEAMKELERGCHPDPADIVNGMRRFRNLMVQTPEQFDLVCRFIIRNDLSKNPRLGWRDRYHYLDYFKPVRSKGGGLSFGGESGTKNLLILPAKNTL